MPGTCIGGFAFEIHPKLLNGDIGRAASRYQNQAGTGHTVAKSFHGSPGIFALTTVLEEHSMQIASAQPKPDALPDGMLE